MKHRLALAIVLGAAWWMLSGYTKPLLLMFGVLSIVLVLWIARRMRIDDDEGDLLGLLPRSLTYAPWLGLQIVKANLDVARRILSPTPAITPRLLRIKAGQRTDLGRTLYANSLTLTPSTVSIDLRGDEIVVHALTREAAEALLTGEMDRRVCALEMRRT